MKSYILPLLMTVSLSSAALAEGGYRGPDNAPQQHRGAIASGGYAGPSNVSAVTTVAEALKADDDAPVVLEGYVTQRVAHEKYEFSDASGKILIEIDDKDWPAGQVISDTTKVRIFGEVDRHRFRPTDIDVDRIQPVL